MLLILPKVTLVLAGALALVNLWLSVRVGKVRGTEKVSVGDGGNERVIRRMRAHANFVENAWIVLALVLILELSLGTSAWLWAAAGLFVLARIGHGLGMDGWKPGRMGGTLVTMVLQLALGLWAIAVPLTAHAPRADPTTDLVSAQG